MTLYLRFITLQLTYASYTLQEYQIPYKMQENEAEILSAKQTPAKEAKNKELLVARYAFAPYKLTKLQIAGTEVTSLAQALNVVKNLLNKEKAIAIIAFNATLLQSKDKVKDIIIS